MINQHEDRSADLEELVLAWIKYQTAALNGHPGLEDHEDFDMVMAVSGLVTNHPESAIAFIEHVLQQTENKELMAVLAAGPLEDLLVYHGPAVIDRIEVLAQCDSRFRQILEGVWRNTIDPDTWERLERIRQS